MKEQSNSKIYLFSKNFSSLANACLNCLAFRLNFRFKSTLFEKSCLMVKANKAKICFFFFFF